MKKSLGFSSFEFYFVVSVIGLILIVGIQRYFRLAEETQRLSFEILANNFSSVVYTHRARWLMAQQSSEKTDQLKIDDRIVQFSSEGWPVAVDGVSQQINIPACLSLWNSFLQPPPLISFTNGEPYGAHQYHLSVTVDGKCRFESVNPKGFYFEYSPSSGQVKTFTLPIAKNS